MTVVRKTFLPETIGEDQPRPGMSAVHSTFSDLDHLSGRLELMAEGLEEGPRNPGHSGSPAKAQAMVSDRMTLLIILLDYKFRDNVTDAVDTGGQIIRG